MLCGLIDNDASNSFQLPLPQSDATQRITKTQLAAIPKSQKLDDKAEYACRHSTKGFQNRAVSSPLISIQPSTKPHQHILEQRIRLPNPPRTDLPLVPAVVEELLRRSEGRDTECPSLLVCSSGVDEVEDVDVDLS